MYNILIYAIWVIVRVTYNFIDQEKKFNFSILKQSIVLSFYLIMLMYVTNIYIFGAFPYVVDQIKIYSVDIYNIFRKIILFAPIITDFTTEVAVNKLKFSFSNYNSYENKYLMRVIAFPMIAFGYEILLIVVTFVLLYFFM